MVAQSPAPLAPFGTATAAAVVTVTGAPPSTAHLDATDDLAARELLTVVTVGHVDHGKSTLVGRLMADTGTIPEMKIEAVRQLCERQGKVFEYAFLLDALEAEREQGITIDAARAFFRSDARDYILVDAPGHVEFIRNMVSGAARADAALLLLDAHEGIRDNSRRHGKLLGLLGIRQVLVVVNKLDLIGYGQARFEELVASYGVFLAECGVTPVGWVPVSARSGDNVVTPTQAMPWYQGPTLLQAMDQLASPHRNDAGPLRMPVQDVYKFNRRGNDERLIVGRLEGGVLRVGDEVVFSPSGKRSTVRGLRAFNSPDPTDVSAGENATIVLADELYLQRGEMMHHADAEVAPPVGRSLRGRIFWLGRKPMRVGGVYGVRLGTAEIEAELIAVEEATDAATLVTVRDVAQVERNQIAVVELRLEKPLAADVDTGVAETRRFVLLDGYDIWGGGQLLSLEPLRGDSARAIEYVERLQWRPQAVPAATLRARRGHGPILVLIAGEAGLGKGRCAAALQRALHAAGIDALLLDCDDPLAKAPRDTSAEAARERLLADLRRTVQPLLGAGLAVIATSNALGLGDHGRVLEDLPAPAYTILLSPDRSARLVDADAVVAGDPTASDALAPLVDRIVELSRADANASPTKT